VPATVVLVACTARKAASAQPPRRLYTSPWFQEAARCAEALGCWYVISAAHGLLDPDGPPVEPYDWVCLACGQTGVGSGGPGGGQVAGQLTPLLWPRDVVVLLAGKCYRDALRPGLRALGVRIEEPLAHVAGVSVQRRWLQRRAEKFE
jgi:hypothetical protein